jgi:hypothetical protein
MSLKNPVTPSGIDPGTFRLSSSGEAKVLLLSGIEPRFSDVLLVAELLYLLSSLYSGNTAIQAKVKSEVEGENWMNDTWSM